MQVILIEHFTFIHLYTKPLTSETVPEVTYRIIFVRRLFIFTGAASNTGNVWIRQFTHITAHSRKYNIKTASIFSEIVGNVGITGSLVAWAWRFCWGQFHPLSLGTLARDARLFTRPAPPLIPYLFPEMYLKIRDHVWGGIPGLVNLRDSEIAVQRAETTARNDYDTDMLGRWLRLQPGLCEYLYIFGFCFKWSKGSKDSVAQRPD